MGISKGKGQTLVADHSDSLLDLARDASASKEASTSQKKIQSQRKQQQRNSRAELVKNSQNHSTLVCRQLRLALLGPAQLTVHAGKGEAARQATESKQKEEQEGSHN